MSKRMAVRVESSQCIGCGYCLEVCPAFVFEMIDAKAAVVRVNWCIGCGQCGSVCPREAIHPKGTKRELPPSSPAVSPERLLMLFRERRSVRRCRDTPIPKAVLERILDAGRYGPTGRNSQNVNYVVLSSPEKIEALRKQKAL